MATNTKDLRRASGGRRGQMEHMPHRSLPVTAFSYAGAIEDPKFGGRIVYESGIERDALIHLAFEQSADWVRRNDLTDEERGRYRMPRADRSNWTLTLENRSTVTADLLVGLLDQRMLLVEVGPHADKTSPAEAERLKRASIVAAAEGVGYVVLTDRMIHGRLLENRRVLFGWLKQVSATEELVAEASQCFTADRQRTMQEVADELERTRGVDASVADDAIQTAIARAHRAGRLRCDLDEMVFGVATPCAIVATEVPA